MKAETKVGLLFVVAIAMVAAFAWYLGALNPFSRQNELWIAYNFAGGVEVGSPVRVMGIKVGKVQAIEFAPSSKLDGTDEVNLRLRISVSKEAWPTVRTDSKYFINLAGVIGEKFVEITPGTSAGQPLQSGATVRGEDPPRIDQMISQSYSLAGKLLSMVEKNEGSITDTLDKMNTLVTNVNKTLALLEKTSKNKEFGHIVNNVSQITDDVAALTLKARSAEFDRTMGLVHDLIWRMEKVDDKSIHKFLQEEGIRARLF